MPNKSQAVIWVPGNKMLFDQFYGGVIEGISLIYIVMYMISTLFLLAAWKASRAHNVTISPRSLNDVHISVAWATQLCRSNVVWIRQLLCTHLTCYFRAEPKIPYQYCAGPKFEEDLQETLKKASLCFLWSIWKRNKEVLFRKFRRQEMFSFDNRLVTEIDKPIAWSIQFI